ncbi:RidA family protein [Frankia sp. CNm7]|uniref:RidA family protein n=1 Tax=Frankia nepalensis TaxID=1836974 RepID=A0A937RJ51_9ACTN|nr:RidA family protein [Frankia nepalensis]MBL7496235.1 RidA family protein [Frankia nepalensis]MBL7514904.1 RidA family protein [Frankia nepalensis]MBL7524320.1 RidA family protein [Frankia nepalensis]MBL7631132.1 RidA family protein [Frankia nepalensis]
MTNRAGTEAAPSERLRALGLELPPVPTPQANYVPAVRDGEWIWTAGQIPLVAGQLPETGLVGAEVTPERATALARICALNALAAAAAVAGGLDRIRRIVKVVGFVASAPGFTGQPAVINGASDLLGQVFGEAGQHARSAVGAAALPLGSPVEVELIALAHPDLG